MKELVYKTIDGTNPRKKEVSIEEIQDFRESHVTKKWICKYFVRSQHHSRSARDMEKWLKDAQENKHNIKNCHILRHKDSKTGMSKVLCKVMGEFFVVRGLTAYKIVYVNSLKITMSFTGGRGY